MKQVVLDYKGGEVQLLEVPVPVVQPGALLIQNLCSAVSVGTEKLMMELARKSLLGKARARPDLVRQVIAKVRAEGLVEAYRAAMARLDTPVPLGYSCAGRVLSVGEGVGGLQVGDGVACFGSGHASHAEVVCVPQNLCVPVPAGVGWEAAALVGPGAIALHTVRLSEPTLGERVVVIGLGLLGQMAVQMLVAAGARVFGVDLDAEKNALARELGADDAAAPGPGLEERVVAWADGRGADAVVVLAASDSAEPVDLAAAVAREQGRVVVPGMVELRPPRRPFYEKELRLVVPRSAGPGVYDVRYEEKGQDYPVGYVRWTAQRNMVGFLDLVAQGKVRAEPIVTHRFPVGDALAAYQLVAGGTARHMGVLLTYPEVQAPMAPRVWVTGAGQRPPRDQAATGIALIGAGVFARATLLPILKGMGNVSRRGVATASGLSARHAATRFGFAYCTADYKELLADPDVDAVIIATRHNLHAPLAAEALAAGKDVLLEKPLATTPEGLARVTEAQSASAARLMVGFNRRFSPFAIRARQALERRGGPVVLHCRVNAGRVPPGSWVVDPVEGGGRVIGEVCHFVDLVQYLAGSRPARVHATGARKGGVLTPDENLAVTLEMEDGSAASITYVTMGSRAFPRERVECFWDSAVCVIDNFRSLLIVQDGKGSRMRRWGVDRGHRGELEAFIHMVRTGDAPPVPFQEYVDTTLTTFAIVEALKGGGPVDVDARVLGVTQ